MALNKVPYHLINSTGLDADYLDGKTSTDFSPWDHNHDGRYLRDSHPSSNFTKGSDGLVKYAGADVKVKAAATADNSTQWGGLKVWRGTQAQYNAIANKDANILYLVKK